MKQAAEPAIFGPNAAAGAYVRNRYAILFYTLLLTMSAAPLAATFNLPGAFIEFFFAANLLAAVMPGTAGSGRGTLLGLTAAIWLGRRLAAWLNQPALSAMILGAWTIIGLMAAANVLRFALRAKQIHAEHVYAALSAYLLAGIFFGLFYWVIDQIGPGAFAMTGEFSLMSALYFSFVTLATLGYGDVVPRTDLARGLAIVEAVGGQLFLAVLVARLVSLYAGARPEKS
jgi:hypothetical protein